MVSFLTNTNQQHYSGQAQLSYLSQMVGIVGLQVVTPMMGLALVVATLARHWSAGATTRARATRRRCRAMSATTGWTSIRADAALHAAAVPGAGRCC